MGLGMSVGVLGGAFGQIDGETDDWAQFFRADIQRINRHLRRAGLPEHQEPQSLPAEALASYDDMYGYSGIHILRRFAAHLRAGRVPAPLRDREEPTRDRLLMAYHHRKVASPLGNSGLFLLKSPPTVGPHFDHLVFHSDCDGYYLPLPLEQVLCYPQSADAVSVDGGLLDAAKGGMTYLGSSTALQRECELIAQALQLPLALDPESAEVENAVEDEDPRATGWRRFAKEAFICLRLYHACQRSIHYGPAVVFH
jgi:hypothetical protein